MVGKIVSVVGCLVVAIGCTSSASPRVSEHPPDESPNEPDSQTSAATDDLASAKWVPGDLHVHAECGDDRLTSAQLVAQMKTAGLQVAASLVWGPDFAKLHAGFTGQDDPISTEEAILHPDLELSGFAAGQAGHMTMLGLQNIDFSPTPMDAPLSSVNVADWAAGQTGALAGYSHAWAWPAKGFPQAQEEKDCCIPFELPVNVARGKTTFLLEEANDANVSDLGAKLSAGPLTDGGWVLWRSMQNLGYRVAIGGGSDNGCLSDEMGKPRTLALIDGTVTYAKYIDALRQGRTILASDRRDKVDLTINGKRIGSELALPGPGSIDIELSGDLSADSEVEVLINGVSVERATLSAGQQKKKLTLAIDKSAWVVARSKRVLTSPIYVLVAGAPIRGASEDACYMVKYMTHLRGLAEKAARPEQALYFGTDRANIFATYAEVKGEFEKRFTESGGTRCEP